MPSICHFYGIAIYLYYNDHAPPHFHAIYGEHDAAITIETFEVIEGYLPNRALALVIEWARIRQAELRRDWQLARGRVPLEPIAPLD